MAYFLRTSQGTGEYVDIPAITASTNVWSFYIVFKATSSSNSGYLLSADVGTVSRVILFDDDTGGAKSIKLRINPDHNFDVTSIDFSQRTKLEFVSDGTDINLYINDSLHDTAPGAAAAIPDSFGRILEGPGSTATDYDLYEAYFDSGFTQERRYDPSATNGTGSVLEDTISAQNGTLTGFPTDDSQWVAYTASPSVFVSGPLTPGGTISGTYADYTTTPTTLEGIRGTNTISSAGASPQITGLTITPDADPASGSFTATISPLVSTGTQQFLRFSDSAQGVVDPTWRLS